jgi:hypothetical protein
MVLFSTQIGITGKVFKEFAKTNFCNKHLYMNNMEGFVPEIDNFMGVKAIDNYMIGAMTNLVEHPSVDVLD